MTSLKQKFQGLCVETAKGVRPVKFRPVLKLILRLEFTMSNADRRTDRQWQVGDRAGRQTERYGTCRCYLYHTFCVLSIIICVLSIICCG